MRFEELDWRRTPLGELVLRRRWDPAVRAEVYEIKLDDEFLMSSLFTVSETRLGQLAVAEAPEGALDVAVGGLGLGHTALAVLDEPRVHSVTVVDALGEVIDWHRRGLLPAGQRLGTDPRCRLVHADFFEVMRTGAPLDPDAPGRRYHALVVDIDHSPRHLLDPANADFYEPDGLRGVGRRLTPDGVFALWSNDPPDEEFTDRLGKHFVRARAEIVRFPNPLQNREASSTLYLADTPRD
ncbi:polyamine aminopropyltransferase [Saccharomonospora iraqiensis]|uniref:hypothetical protein n=1 Tax=Saccharomonospora iraqiensis TaxID=52698 RepID=UPI00022E1274|nr:hypothetical protein [Saccharomonospora iraqiensis]